ncbi:MAG: hypothetical protein JO211_04230, partial [Acidobacteriaceae bacterium]|nr:hypothetical protein [Acidobacteriaceae bacterium]
FCRSCGRPLCTLCQRSSEGTIYCQDHAPFSGYAQTDTIGAAGANPYFQPPPVPPVATPVHTSPALAFILGWIPGVGAIYNGQYVKGLIHAVIFALIVSILNSDLGGSSEAFLGIMLAAFVIYMPFEAYQTARRRQMGIAPPMWGHVAEEWSGMMAGSPSGSRAPIGPILLIGIGILFLLDTLHLIQFREIGRFWPVALIIAGGWMLYSRLQGSRVSGTASSSNPGVTTRPTSTTLETPHEQ